MHPQHYYVIMQYQDVYHRQSTSLFQANEENIQYVFINQELKCNKNKKNILNLKNDNILFKLLYGINGKFE